MLYFDFYILHFSEQRVNIFVNYLILRRGQLGLSCFAAYDDILNSCGFVHQFSAAETTSMHSHDGFYEFFFTVNGRAIHLINNKRAMLFPGSLVLIRPEDVHSYEALSKYDVELISVGFKAEDMRAVCQYMGVDLETVPKYPLPPSVVLDGYNRTDIQRKLLHIPRHEEGYDRHSYFLSFLPSLILRVLISSEDKPENDMPFWLYALIDKMNERENFIIGLPRLIELSERTQEHITRAFSKYLKMTPGEFINMKRLNLACTLLLENQKSIIDISYECGFSSLSYFYHCFKQQYGCPPKEFVKEYHRK